MTVLVTGAGLLGLQVAAKLVEKGEKAILYDIAYDLESLPTIADMEKITTVTGDLVDLPLLIDVIEGEAVKRIIHTASLLLSGVRARTLFWC
jgi:nucleoside-diphosphate-sugar epimerase